MKIHMCDICLTEGKFIPAMYAKGFANMKTDLCKKHHKDVKMPNEISLYRDWYFNIIGQAQKNAYGK